MAKGLTLEQLKASLGGEAVDQNHDNEIVIKGQLSRINDLKTKIISTKWKIVELQAECVIYTSGVLCGNCLMSDTCKSISKL